MDIEEIKKKRKKEYIEVLKYTNPKYDGEIPSNLLEQLNHTHERLVNISTLQWIDKHSELISDPLVKLGSGRISRLSEI